MASGETVSSTVTTGTADDCTVQPARLSSADTVSISIMSAMRPREPRGSRTGFRFITVGQFESAPGRQTTPFEHWPADRPGMPDTDAGAPTQSSVQCDARRGITGPAEDFVTLKPRVRIVNA